VDGVGGSRARVRKGGFATRRDTERVLTELTQLPGARAAARMWTVGGWLRFWLVNIERSGAVRPSTLVGYQRAVDCYLVPEFDRLRLSKLRTKQVQRGLDRIARRTTRTGRLIAASTVHGIRAVLRSALWSSSPGSARS
jgi:Phage integrase, N-terminal SAM-like domain